MLIVAFFVGASTTNALMDDSFAAKDDNNGNNGCENANPNAKACENNPNTNNPPTIESVSIFANGNDVTGGSVPLTNPSSFLCTANNPMDADDDTVTFTFKWFQRGSLINTGNTLSYTSVPLLLGELLTCEVTPFDGTDFGVPVSASVLVGCPPNCGF